MAFEVESVVNGGVHAGLTIVGRLLGHADAKTTSRCSHLRDGPLRRVTNSVGSSLAAAMGEYGAGEVVPIRRKI